VTGNFYKNWHVPHICIIDSIRQPLFLFSLLQVGGSGKWDGFVLFVNQLAICICCIAPYRYSITNMCTLPPPALAPPPYLPDLHALLIGSQKKEHAVDVSQQNILLLCFNGHTAAHGI